MEERVRYWKGMKSFGRENEREEERKALIEGEWFYKEERKKKRGTVRGGGVERVEQRESEEQKVKSIKMRGMQKKTTLIKRKTGNAKKK